LGVLRGLLRRPEPGGRSSVRASMLGILLNSQTTAEIDQKQALNCHQSIEILYQSCDPRRNP
jgi:hypothetical protein